MGYWTDGPDRVCECGHDLEYCHDDEDPEGGECAVYGCPCKQFKERAVNKVMP